MTLKPASAARVAAVFALTGAIAGCNLNRGEVSNPAGTPVDTGQDGLKAPSQGGEVASPQTAPSQPPAQK